MRRRAEWWSPRRLCYEKTVCATEKKVDRSNREPKLKMVGSDYSHHSRRSRVTAGESQLRAALTAGKLSPSFWKVFGFYFTV